MTPLEQQGLLLRQVASLRRGGVPHHRALELASGGLPAGPLRNATEGALRSLSAGVAARPDADPVQAILVDGTAPIDRLDHGAAAVEARLWAQASLRTTRLYLSLAVASPLAIASLLGWALPSDMYEGVVLPAPTRAVVALGTFLQYTGIPLAAGAVFVVNRVADRMAPGFGLITQAAALLDAAARGDGTPPLAPDDQRYFLARRQTVGARAAARELAEELTREGQTSLYLFRYLVPVLGGLVGFLAVVTALAFLVLPLLGIAEYLE